MGAVEPKNNNHAEAENTPEKSGVIGVELVQFFDALARFDFEDKRKEKINEKTNEH
jgi:hypothetical protein